MNINLQRAVAAGDDEVDLVAETIEASLEEHRAIMEKAGYNLTGNTALLNEPNTDGTTYPGSYRVWLETTSDTWIYIDPEGNANEAAYPNYVIMP